jgi:spore coat polysaccharide biosynthesis protein SpsF (cytidylyltransferase family)
MCSVAIITARWSSTRLPGKMLSDINGKPLLQWVVDRCRLSNVDDVVVATTKDSLPIIQYCMANKIHFYIGDENDIVSRLYHAAVKYNADVIIRVWGDSPCIEPLVIDNLLELRVDYAYRDNGSKGTGAARLTFRKLEKDNSTLTGDDRHWYHKYCWPDLSVDDAESLERVRAILV